MTADLLLAIDQGTTGTTALVMDTRRAHAGPRHREFAQHFPAPGWVEHEPDEIWQSVLDAVKGGPRRGGRVGRSRIAAIGITNQRETTVLWDRATGAPIHRAIVWQDRRTASRCAELRAAGTRPRARDHGPRARSVLQRDEGRVAARSRPGARARAEKGELAFGTIDSFLVWRLSGGGRGAPVHVTDVTNASRTLLMSLETLDWDASMLALLGVPRRVLPKIVPSAEIDRAHPRLRVCPTACPSRASPAISRPRSSGRRASAWATRSAPTARAPSCWPTSASARSQPLWAAHHRGVADRRRGAYALEGSAFIAGAAVQWLRDGLGIIKSAAEIEALARRCRRARASLRARALGARRALLGPRRAKGSICGITRGTTKAHLARATLEGIALEVNDLLGAMADDLGAPLRDARRRRRRGQRPADAVPGGRGGDGDRASLRARVDGARRGDARGRGRGPVRERRRSEGGNVPGRAAVRGRRWPKSAARAAQAAVGRGASVAPAGCSRFGALRTPGIALRVENWAVTNAGIVRATMNRDERRPILLNQRRVPCKRRIIRVPIFCP
jgi:glycerol kinase